MNCQIIKSSHTTIPPFQSYDTDSEVIFDKIKYWLIHGYMSTNTTEQVRRNFSEFNIKFH